MEFCYFFGGISCKSWDYHGETFAILNIMEIVEILGYPSKNNLNTFLHTFKSKFHDFLLT